MPDTGPVVCRVLKLPPEQHILFRLKDMLEEILRELDNLNLALRASHETQPKPEALELLHDTRAEAATQAMGLFRVVYFVNNFARIFAKFLVAVSPSASSSAKQGPISIPYLRVKTGIVTKECEKVQKEMIQFGQDATGTVERAASLLRTHNEEKSTETALSEENARSVSGLLRAVNECASGLQDVGNFFREMEKHLGGLSEAMEATPPSDEELDTVRSRWTDFHTASGQVFADVANIRGELSDDPLIFTEDDIPRPRQAAGASPTEPRTDPRAIEDSPSAPAPKRSFFRRLISCFTIWGLE